MPDGETERLTADMKSTYLTLERTYTISELINHMGYGKFQCLTTLVAFVGASADAMEILLISVIGVALQCDWGLTKMEIALFTMVVFIGYFFGAGCWGWLSDQYGRRPAIIMSAFITAYYSGLCGLAPTYGWLVVLRACVGFALSGVPNGLVYIAEVTPAEQRAYGIMAATIFWCIGTITESGLAMVLLPLENGWRILVIVTAAPMLIAGVCFKFLPESPRYFVSANRPKKALESINVIAACNGRQLINTAASLPMLIHCEEKASFCDIFYFKIRYTTILVSLLGFMSAFMYYGVVLYTAELLNAPSSRHYFPTNQTVCRVHCKGMDREDFINLMITASAELPGTLVGIFLAIVMTRRRLLMVCAVATAISTSMLMLPKTTPHFVLFLLVISRGASIATTNAFYLYTIEVFPTTIRSCGLAWAGICARLGCILTPLVAIYIMSKFELLAIIIYVAASVSAFVIALLLPMETKHIDLEDNLKKSD